MLSKGDRVEDTRAKRIFDPDPNNCYSGIFGTVTEVSTNGSFRVKWPTYEMGYDAAFEEMGIKKI